MKTTAKRTAHDAIWGALTDIEDLATDMDTVIPALGTLREGLLGLIAEMDTSTMEAAAISAKGLVGAYPGYDALLDLVLRALRHYADCMETAVEGAYTAARALSPAADGESKPRA